MKLVADWMNIPLLEVLDLDMLTYLSMRKDAFISAMDKTEKGIEYLNGAWTLTLTEPDREASRAAFGVRG